MCWFLCRVSITSLQASCEKQFAWSSSLPSLVWLMPVISPRKITLLLTEKHRSSSPTILDWWRSCSPLPGASRVTIEDVVSEMRGLDLGTNPIVFLHTKNMRKGSCLKQLKKSIMGQRLLGFSGLIREKFGFQVFACMSQSGCKLEKIAVTPWICWFKEVH